MSSGPSGDILLTIVIPFLNSGATIVSTLDSLSHSLQNCHSPGAEKLEFLLVDNNSVDDSLEKVLRWIGDHPNIQALVVSEPTPGVSVARNHGVREARGSYVGFVDSDDCVSMDYFTCVLDALSCSPDVVVMPYLEDQASPSPVVSTPADVSQILSVLRGWWNWQFICRRSSITLLGFEGTCFEDMGVFPVILERSNSFMLVHSALYEYSDQPGSVTKNPRIDFLEQLSNQAVRLFAQLDKKGLIYKRLRSDVFFLSSIYRSMNAEFPVRSLDDLSSFRLLVGEKGVMEATFFLINRTFIAMRQRTKRFVGGIQ